MASLLWLLILILVFGAPAIRRRINQQKKDQDKDTSSGGSPFGNGSGSPFGNGNGSPFGNGSGSPSGNGSSPFGAAANAGQADGGAEGTERAQKRSGKRDRRVRRTGGRPGFPIGKVLLAAVIAVFVLMVAFGSFYSVSEQENAVVTQFGKIVRTDTAGLYFKVPFLQSVRMVDITTHGTGVGYTVSDTGQNIEDAGDGIMITSDFNLLNIDFYLEYKVDDPVAYLYNSEDPEGILKNVALASIRSVVSNYAVDDAMTTGKNQIQADVKETMMQELDENDIGLQVVNITVQDSEPPTDQIKQAFKAVETAKQGADTARNNALQYQNSQLPSAEAQADKIVQDATAAKEARIAEATGQVSRFNAEYDEYIKYPEVTKKRMFYETMEDILPDLKVIISDGGTETLLPLDSFSGNGTDDSSGSADSASSAGSAGTSSGNASAGSAAEAGTNGGN